MNLTIFRVFGLAMFFLLSQSIVYANGYECANGKQVKLSNVKITSIETENAPNSSASILMPNITLHLTGYSSGSDVAEFGETSYGPYSHPLVWNSVYVLAYGAYNNKTPVDILCRNKQVVQIRVHD